MVYASAERGWAAGLDEGDRLFEPVYLSQERQGRAARLPREARAEVDGAERPYGQP